MFDFLEGKTKVPASPFAPLAYDAEKLTPGVVALGFGNFTRAFVMRFLDDLAIQGNKEVGVIGIARSEREGLVFKNLTAQNFKYHLVERCATEEIKQIGVLRGILIGQNDPAGVIDRIAHPATRLVTMTVTKDAYKENAQTAADVTAIQAGQYDKVETITGWLTAGLHKRFTEGKAPPTILSCDNVTANGDLVGKIITSLATQVSPEFGAYVREQVRFPNTTVDRMAPIQNYDVNAAHMKERYGISDKAAFVCEGGPAMFVIENTMTNLFPPFDKAGAKYVADTAPYAELKLRGLNGYHKVIGMVGKVLGIKDVADAMGDKSVRPFMLTLMDQAMAGLNTKPENADLAKHNEITLARLDNRLLPDTTSRLVRDTWSSVPERIVNAAAIDRDVPSNAAAFATAIWLRYMKGHDDSGNVYQLTSGDIGDEKGPRMKQLGLRNHTEIEVNLGKFLSGKASDSPQMAVFVGQTLDYFKAIETGGLRRALEIAFPDTNPSRTAERHAMPCSDPFAPAAAALTQPSAQNSKPAPTPPKGAGPSSTALNFTPAK